MVSAPDGLMILVAVIGLVASIASKKKAKAQKQAAAQRREAVDPKAAPGAAPRTSPAKAPSSPSKFPTAGPSKFPTSANRQTAAAQKPQSRAAAPNYGGTPRYTHVVTSTLEGGHSHTESSMTGEESCPPPKAVPVQQQPQAQRTSDAGMGDLISFDPHSVLEGVVFAEILGKPRSLQRK